MTANDRQAAAWNGPEGANWAEHSAERVDDGDLIEPLLDAALAPYLTDDGVRIPGSSWLVQARK